MDEDDPREEIEELFQIIEHLKTQINQLSSKYNQLIQSGKFGFQPVTSNTTTKSTNSKKSATKKKNEPVIDIGTIELKATTDAVAATEVEVEAVTTSNLSSKQSKQSTMSKKIKRPLWVDFVENA